MAPSGHYNKELFWHLVYARRANHVQPSLARWLMPQIPSVLAVKETLRVHISPAQQLLQWLDLAVDVRSSEGRAVPWSAIAKLLQHELAAPWSMVPNVARMLGQHGYKTSGLGHPHVRFDGIGRGPALTKGGVIMTLRVPYLQKLQEHVAQSAPTVASMLGAA